MRGNRDGFTIIEVMIVLVIAAVIILIVFLAVPAAQRNQRNIRRRRDASVLIPAVREQKVNNNNVMPNSCSNATSSCFINGTPLSYYSNGGSTSNKTVSYGRLNAAWAPPEEQLDPNDTATYTDAYGNTYQETELVQVRTYTKCGPNGIFTGTGASPDNIAAQFVIETGSGGRLQCVES